LDIAVGGTTEELRVMVDQSSLSSPTISYQWLLNGKSIDGATEDKHEPPEEARAAGLAYSVRVVITDGNTMVTQTSTEFIVPNARPMIEGFTPASPVSVNEGTTQTITAMVSDPNFDVLGYEWRVTNNAHASLLAGVKTDEATLTFIPADNFVDDAAATQTTVILTLTVTDGAGESDEQDITVTVRKQSRGIRLRAKVFLEVPLQ